MMRCCVEFAFHRSKLNVAPFLLFVNLHPCGLYHWGDRDICLFSLAFSIIVSGIFLIRFLISFPTFEKF